MRELVYELMFRLLNPQKIVNKSEGHDIFMRKRQYSLVTLLGLGKLEQINTDELYTLEEIKNAKFTDKELIDFVKKMLVFLILERDDDGHNLERDDDDGHNYKYLRSISKPLLQKLECHNLDKIRDFEFVNSIRNRWLLIFYKTVMLELLNLKDHDLYQEKIDWWEEIEDILIRISKLLGILDEHYQSTKDEKVENNRKFQESWITWEEVLKNCTNNLERGLA